MRASWMAALAAICVVVVSAPAQAAPAGGGYVALGDSYSAGSGLFPLANNPAVTPFCAQASRNYPKLVQRELGFSSFTDETCGGAKTVDMTSPQTLLGIFGGGGAGSKFDIVQNGPQFNALRPDTALVTLGIGGNDIGFAEIIGKCIAPWPTGTFCRHGFTRGGVDRVRGRIDELRVLLRGVLEGIRARSPQARIVTIGYPRILPPDPRRSGRNSRSPRVTRRGWRASSATSTRRSVRRRSPSAPSTPTSNPRASAMTRASGWRADGGWSRRCPRGQRRSCTPARPVSARWRTRC